MEQQISSIGLLMKAARRFKKFNQSEVAEAIGCSQSALSKMEHNILTPSAPQWFLFSRFTSIPPESIETGVIDRHTLVKLNNDEVSLGYKLPKRYRVNRAQKIRELYPYLFYLEKKGGELFTQFMSNVGIDPEFFLDFDNLINFQLNVDLINLYFRLGIDTPEEIRSLVELGQTEIYWGEHLFGADDPQDLLLKFSQRQREFQGDFRLIVETPGRHFLFSYIPEPHLYHFLKDVTDDVSRWISYYRKFSLEQLVRRTFNQEIEVRLIPELSRSPLESRFEIY
jgi:transcriptional regulator with XRE-family HTH domain